MSELGLFPLGIVLLPTEQIPLHIFEDRYQELIGECLDLEQEFGLIYADDDGLRDIGTRAEVTEVLDRFDDGRLNIVVQGGERFRLLELTDGRSFQTALVEPIEDEVDAADPEDSDHALTLFHRLVELTGAEVEEPSLAAEQLSFELAGRFEFAPELKQKLLQLTSERQRMHLLAEILAGAATPAQVAGFAVALRAKGETKAELQGLVDAMLGRAHRLTVDERVVDVVGTGGDRAKTVNISSMAAVVTAGAGIGVVKHGNRAASSASGTADVFEVLGIALDVPADRVLDVYRRAAITFCFAPLFHGSMRHAGPTRGELAIPTFFNFLGPLTNPAQPAASAIGCFDPAMAPLMASVLADRGADAFVFRGDDGLDELTTTTTSRVWVVSGGSVRETVLDPRDLGLTLGSADGLRGGDPVFNAHVFRRVIEGEVSPVRDAVLLNAGAAIAAHAGGDDDLVVRIAAGIERAKESIDSGSAATTLRQWAEATQALRA